MLPKLCGTDVELGNFVLGTDRPGSTCAAASAALLAEIDGTRAGRPGGDGRDPQDRGRTFLSNGGCAYIDLDHLELATPETTSAVDQVACKRAMLRIAQQALRQVNSRLGRGLRIQALVNNSDGAGNSYGAHCNFLVTREAFDRIFTRPAYLQCLAAFQASSIVFTGQGKVGSENSKPFVPFQLSQRADFMEVLTGVQTTCRRPIVNARDEPLCGAAQGRGMARVHAICFDATLCPVASLLTLGCMQIVLAMIEAGWINVDVILDSAVDAMVAWSRDPGLEARANLRSRGSMTAVEVQMRFLDDASRFVAAGRCEGVVPGATEILALWARTLDRLRRRDFEALIGDLDWVTKREMLQRFIDRADGMGWDAPQLKHLDLLFSSLDADDGLYWACEREGLVHGVVPEERIAWLVEHPPEDTRAWTRTMLLDAAGDRVEHVDWDRVRLTKRYPAGWCASTTVHLADPLAWSRVQTGHLFENGRGVDAIIEGLAALAPRAPGPWVH